MTRDAYFDLARRLAHDSGVTPEIHGYFEQHRDRLWRTIQAFELCSRRFQRVLCIGPYFDYTPFFYKAHVADAVTVLEADPPTAPLERSYRAQGIEFVRDDLMRIFSSPKAAERRLPWPDDAFDLICCWETMEHLNFNPVPFVRELHRVARRDGWVCVTVPNAARLGARLRLLFGKSIGTPVADYQYWGGEPFYGFHWREYTLAELARLFEANAFHVEMARHLRAFQNRPLSVAGKIKRLCGRAVIAFVPAFASICLVKAVKPAAVVSA